MAFWGLDFIFDHEFSLGYGVKIISIDGSSVVTEANAGSGIEIFSDSVFRNPTVFQYGVSQSEVLTFDMEIASETPIAGINRSKIQKWLFGRMKPCHLQIVQTDLQDIYFNCYLTNASTTYIGNYCYGFKFTVECDAPWAWQIARTYTQKQFNDIWRFYNNSDNTDYTYPILEFKLKQYLITDGDISITNITDNNRKFELLNCYPGEVIKVDCQRQIISSSRNRLLSGFFNKKFFRLLPSQNEIDINGELEYLSLTYSDARKVGG